VPDVSEDIAAVAKLEADDILDAVNESAHFTLPSQSYHHTDENPVC
jgi:hypothetical protein